MDLVQEKIKILNDTQELTSNNMSTHQKKASMRID